MATDIMCVTSLIMMCALGYCVIKLCLCLINASTRILQTMGTGEQMQRAADNARGLPPIYTPTRNTYVERRVTKSISKSSVLAVLFRILFDFKSTNTPIWLARRNYLSITMCVFLYFVK